MIKLLVAQSGHLLNMAELANTCNLARQTVERFPHTPPAALLDPSQPCQITALYGEAGPAGRVSSGNCDPCPPGIAQAVG